MCPGFRPRAQIAARVGREAQGDPRGGFHSAGGARRRGARPGRSAGHCAGVLAVGASHWRPPGPAPANARSHPAWRERQRASRSSRPQPAERRGPDAGGDPRQGPRDALPGRSADARTRQPAAGPRGRAVPHQPGARPEWRAAARARHTARGRRRSPRRRHDRRRLLRAHLAQRQHARRSRAGSRLRTEFPGGIRDRREPGLGPSRCPPRRRSCRPGWPRRDTSPTSSKASIAIRGSRSSRRYPRLSQTAPPARPTRRSSASSPTSSRPRAHGSRWEGARGRWRRERARGRPYPASRAFATLATPEKGGGPNVE